jgi:hypothetical protein
MKRWMMTMLTLAACVDTVGTRTVDPDTMDASTDAAGDAHADSSADGSADADATPICTCSGAQPVCLADGGCAECTQDNAGACSGTKPLCGPTNTCVACTATNATACTGATPLCLATSNQCVQCLANPDCKTASASRCAANACAQCTADADCAHIPGQNVCSNGICVACTKDKASACKTASGQPAVCEHAKKLCTTFAVASADTCDACVSDAQCKAANLCVPMTFGQTALGAFCQPVRISNCDAQHPFAKPITTGESIDGQRTPYCTLAFTTCAAVQQGGTGYRTNCGVNANGQPVSTGAVAGRNSLCGTPGLDDGFCVEVGVGSGQFKCTVTCTPKSPNNATSAPDCPDVLGPVDPTCDSLQHESGEGLLCTL